MLLQELHNVRYFDVFEFNASEKHWACFVCNHPEKVSLYNIVVFFSETQAENSKKAKYTIAYF